jgi:CubicO group peptidase (beta-lactamase class C family)
MRFVAGFAACVLSLCATAAPADAPKPATSLGQLDARLAAMFKDGKIPGAEIAIVEHGKVVLLKAYGLADTAKKIPATTDSVFRAGSISKSITAIAVMTLVEQKKLSLDGKLAELAPEVKFVNPWEKTDPVRLVHLLEHTTGWPDISTKILVQDGKGWSVLKGVQFTMPEFTSRWAPGRFSIYNNAGPAVAGVILEKASGQSFNAYVDAHVLRPMGMPTADFDLTPALAPHMAKSYEPSGRETPFQNIILPPAGSLNTNARELAQLVRFFLGRGMVDGKQILSPASVDRIERSESNLASKDGFIYGYGLGNAPFPGSGIVFRGHNGEIDSFTSVYGYLTRCDCGYVLMANGGEGVNFATPVSAEVEHYLTRGLACDCGPAPNKQAAAPSADYAGIYSSITPPNNLIKPLTDLAGLSRVTTGKGLTITGLGGAGQYELVSPHIFRRLDREQPSVAFVEEGGHVYKLTAFNAAEKLPLWRVVLMLAVAAIIVLGTIFAIVMTPVWLFAGFRGRLGERGGCMVRFAPLLSVAALFAAFAMTARVIAGSGTSALNDLATIGPYSLTIFTMSLFCPAFAILGLWLGYRKADASMTVRIYAVLVSVAMLAFCAYALPIGWIGLRSWTM